MIDRVCFPTGENYSKSLKHIGRTCSKIQGTCFQQQKLAGRSNSLQRVCKTHQIITCHHNPFFESLHGAELGASSVENQFCRPENMGRQNGRGHL